LSLQKKFSYFEIDSWLFLKTKFKYLLKYNLQIMQIIKMICHLISIANTDKHSILDFY
jgi:hypothetical protein